MQTHFASITLKLVLLRVFPGLQAWAVIAFDPPLAGLGAVNWFVSAGVAAGLYLCLQRRKA